MPIFASHIGVSGCMAVNISVNSLACPLVSANSLLACLLHYCLHLLTDILYCCLYLLTYTCYGTIVLESEVVCQYFVEQIPLIFRSYQQSSYLRVSVPSAHAGVRGCPHPHGVPPVPRPIHHGTHAPVGVQVEVAKAVAAPRA